MRFIIYLLVLSAFAGCSEFDAGKIKCDEENKCPVNYFCDGYCTPSLCKDEKTDKDNNQCLLTTNDKDWGYSLDVDNNGDIYLTGSTKGKLNAQNNNGENDIFLVKYNKDGEIQQTKLCGSENGEIPKEIVIKDDVIYITGYTEGNMYTNINSGMSDAFLIKWEE